jgi:glycosyltransferase involved in cell wall biosynthesis
MVKRIKVVHYVWHGGKYVEYLVAQLNEIGVDARLAPIWFRKTRYRILAGPLQLIVLRLQGVGIINFHFVQEHFQPLSVNTDRGRKLFYAWYKFFIRLAGLLGFKLVWTGHNIVPHEKVFVDDVLARKFLIDHCDLVMSINEVATEKISAMYHPRLIKTTMPAIADISPTGSYNDLREALDIAQDRIVFSHLGRLRPYKGTQVLLEALDQSNLEATVVIAGSRPQAEAAYVDSLRDATSMLVKQGHDVRLQVQFLSDEELASYYTLSDFLVYPMASITNSAIIQQALYFGLPVICPDLPELAWVPQDAAIRYDHTGGAMALRGALAYAMSLTKTQRLAMGNAGKSHAADWRWPNVARDYRDAYAELLG